MTVRKLRGLILTRQGSKNYSKRVKREVKKTLQEPEPITWNFQKFVIDKGGKVVMNYHT